MDPFRLDASSITSVKTVIGAQKKTMQPDTIHPEESRLLVHGGTTCKVRTVVAGDVERVNKVPLEKV
jgi:hypothetical protein